MKIEFKKIEYSNIKVTTHREIDLSGTGLIMVVGPNGGGKSTIADAFKVCLLDRTLDKKPGNSILSRGKKNGSVKVWFNEHENEYLIENILSQTKSTLNVYKNNILLNGEDGHLSGKNAVKSFLKKFFSESLFNNVLYFSSNRNRSGFFLDLSEPDQKRFLEEVLPNFLLYRKAEEIVKELVSSSKQVLQSAESEMNVVDKELVVRKENLEKEAALIQEFEKSCKEKNFTILEDIQKYNAWLEIAKKEQEKIAEKRKKYVEQERTCRELIQNRESVEKELKEVEEKLVLDFEKRKKVLTDELSEIQKEELSSSKQLDVKLSQVRKAYDEETDSIREQIKKNLENSKLSIDSIESTLQRLIIDKEKKESELKKNLSDIQVLQKSIESKEKICPICKSSLKNSNALIETITEKQKQCEELRKEICEISKKIEVQEKRKLILTDEKIRVEEEAEQTLKELKEKRLTYEQRLREDFEEVKKGLKERTQIVETKIDAVETANKNLLNENVGRLRVVNKLKKALETEQQACVLLNDMREQIVKSESIYSNSAVEEKKSAVKNLTEVIESQKEDLQKRKERYKESVEKYEELQNTRKLEVFKNRKSAEEDVAIYEQLTKVFSHTGIRSWYLDLVIPSFNMILRKNCSGIAPNFKVHLVRDGGDVKLLCKNFVNGSDFDGFSSGERSLISLVVILSISELLSSYEQFSSNVVIFDEVFDSLDRKNSMIVLDALHLLSQKKKVVLLTHNESYKNSELASQIIEVSY